MSRDKTERISVEEYRALMRDPLATNKYNAQGLRHDGHYFDSRMECNRYNILKSALAANYISDLKVHPRYVLTDACEVEGHKQRAVEYEADFEYVYKGRVVTEDVKGFITPDAKRKIKQFQARYGRIVYIVTDYRDHFGGMEKWTNFAHHSISTPCRTRRRSR